MILSTNHLYTPTPTSKSDVVLNFIDNHLGIFAITIGVSLTILNIVSPIIYEIGVMLMSLGIVYSMFPKNFAVLLTYNQPFNINILVKTDL